jgi:redox-sensitive bicupin YhaK (pirin superfamily)
VPERTVDGARVRVVAGRLGDAEGPIRGVATEPIFLDVALAAGGRFEHALPAGHAAFVYVCDGEAEVGAGDGAKPARAKELAVLGAGERVAVAAPAGAARVLVVAGRPLREPVVRYGPFVMNTEAEIHQAIDDFNSGRFSGPAARGAAPTAGTPPSRGA